MTELEHELGAPGPEPTPALPCGCGIPAPRLLYMRSTLGGQIPATGPVDVYQLAKKNAAGIKFGIDETDIFIGHVQKGHPDPTESAPLSLEEPAGPIRSGLQPD